MRESEPRPAFPSPSPAGAISPATRHAEAEERLVRARDALRDLGFVTPAMARAVIDDGFFLLNENRNLRHVLAEREVAA